jgi:uncharacterized protein (DUF433 family)
MKISERVTFDPKVMGGKACIRGMRITVSTVLQMLSRHTPQEVLQYYPELEPDDLQAALEYAAYLAEERLLSA